MATKMATTTAAAVAATEEVKKTKKKFNPEDMILCKSMISGRLNVKGPRSELIYTWADYGDVIEVEYRDLNYLIRGRDIAITETRIVVEDEEFLEEFPDLKKQYDSMYTKSDLMEILSFTPANMEKAIKELSPSLQNSIKDIARTMIDSGRLDSVKKIKTLDGIFGTDLLLTMAES